MKSQALQEFSKLEHGVGSTIGIIVDTIWAVSTLSGKFGS